MSTPTNTNTSNILSSDSTPPAHLSQYWFKNFNGRYVPVNENDPKDVAEFPMQMTPTDLPLYNFHADLSPEPRYRPFTREFLDAVEETIRRERPWYGEVRVQG
ncbi:hypothetical protein CLAFUW4_13480 [Fulvia fulva]|uniref:Uncharacterized protein n=1 Tax=Passalora fulva TaxID=5499 RepID=A0A9Q8PK17_PASFU|nr:uncharacterized protein CLAFUR5_13333 [Fulvia fulva]KAK4611600.1 hypothetical protein CLAFUR4_13483 [Fulvia fulva]KAK4612862.1 hypothetical protein CLAFUR0_13491 [Fulvia fulva]UJO23809.1 hypothetical protein CLAFUR5_13333 [Fulvia fulva]WPV21631.1 hypothetical protein CLAFUW4_13480 [Fulvia fulva]WPV35957.1 hypothetical protein CLAFUW7_13487 [Fulvia fulva]